MSALLHAASSLQPRRAACPASSAALRASVACHAAADGGLRQAALSLCAALAVSLPLPALAEVRLPPVDTDPRRCERAFIGNTIGQANAVSDKLLDLRGCVYDRESLATRVLSGALMVDASFQGTDLTEVVMSKARGVGGLDCWRTQCTTYRLGTEPARARRTL